MAIEVNINFNAPDLCKSIDNLAKAMTENVITIGAMVPTAEPTHEVEQAEAPKPKKTRKAKAEKETPAPAPDPVKVEPMPAPVPALQAVQPAPVPTPVAPVAPAPQQVQPAAVQTPVAPAPAPAPVAPAVATPTAAPVQPAAPTREELTQKVANAGSFIMDTKGIGELNKVLQKYGIQAITEEKAVPFLPNILQDLYLLGAPVV